MIGRDKVLKKIPISLSRAISTDEFLLPNGKTTMSDLPKTVESSSAVSSTDNPILFKRVGADHNDVYELNCAPGDTPNSSDTLETHAAVLSGRNASYRDSTTMKTRGN